MGGTFRELPKESRGGDKHAADFGDHKLDVYKLIHLAEQLKEETIDLDDLGGNLYGMYQKDANDQWLGPRQFIEAYKATPDFDAIIEKHPEWSYEIGKLRNTDYEGYPILLIGDTVIDGMHRLTKAYIEGAKTIRVKKFEDLPKETIIAEQVLTLDLFRLE